MRLGFCSGYMEGRETFPVGNTVCPASFPRKKKKIIKLETLDGRPVETEVVVCSKWLQKLLGSEKENQVRR